MCVYAYDMIRQGSRLRGPLHLCCAAAARVRTPGLCLYRCVLCACGAPRNAVSYGETERSRCCVVRVRCEYRESVDSNCGLHARCKSMLCRAPPEVGVCDTPVYVKVCKAMALMCS